VSDDFGKDYPGDDPFVDPSDPAAVEREERRREREAKRQQKSDKKKQKAASAPPPPSPEETAPPAPPRTPEQEFWDDPADPAPPVPAAESALPKPDPEKAERGRRRLFGRRKGKEATAGAAVAGAAAASEPPPPPTGEQPTPATVTPTVPQPTAATAPPTGEQPTAKPAPPPAPPTGEEALPKAPPPATGESLRPQDPVTGEQPAANAPGPPTGEEPVAGSTGPPTTEQPMPKPSGQPPEKPQEPAAPGPPTAETPRPAADPPTSEAPRPAGDVAAADAPCVDPGPQTAAAPRPDPNQPATGETALPPTASQALPSGEDSTPRGRAAPLPLPVEQAGAGDWEPPPPRDDWFDESDEFDEHDLHDEGDPEMAGAARHGRRHGEDGGRRGGFFGALLRHPFRIFGVIVLIIVLLFLNALFQPFHGDGSGRVTVVIPKGSSVSEVGELLEKKGVISGGFIVSGSTLFQARVSLSGDRSNLIAGKRVLEKDMSYGDAIDALTKEPKPQAQAKPGVVTVTIPEGQSRPITAKLVKEDGIKGNYLKATKKSKVLDPAEYGGKGAKNLEGFLFPDTWELKTKQPVSDLVDLQLADFKKKIKKVNMKYANSKNLAIYDVVTIASMIEREAGVPKQRKLVASVIYNRLHEGMTLGIDSTIRFATGNYEKPLTQSELESESPYNTRTHAGLPPGPINSPGLAALNAAAHPAKTDFLFYVNNPNSCDELTFAKTEEEFTADAEKYEKAREANGGNQPTTCK
jgi:UPF0755 protein